MLEIYKEEVQDVCYCGCGYGCTCMNCHDFAPISMLSVIEYKCGHDNVVAGVM